jgi:hypothetical protein
MISDPEPIFKHWHLPFPPINTVLLKI